MIIDFVQSLAEVLKNSVLITGLVIIMLMLIEYVNIQSHGNIFKKLKDSPLKQVFAGAALGLVPGCSGGFVAVSLYTHGMLSFGALTAMMIASSGDESFVMLAMIPQTAVIIFAVLFLLAIMVGLLVDRFFSKDSAVSEADGHFRVHDDCGGSHDKSGKIFSKEISSNFRNISRKRVLIMLGIVLFAIAITAGLLEHDHEEIHDHVHFEIFSERWINLLFAMISIFALYLTAKANDHFIIEHLWNHVIRKHFLPVFLWTLGALLIIHVGMQYLYFDVEHWIGDNVYFMILLAAIIGLIPESGPHMIFISMFYSGIAPFSVLFTNSIVQDGHTALPLLAESRKDFLIAKMINMIAGIAAGMGLHLLTGI